MKNKIISCNSLFFFILRMKFVTLYWLHHWFASFNRLVYFNVLKNWFYDFFFHTLVSYSPYLMKKFLSILTKKTYFFYFTYSLFENTLHQIIYFTLYFFKILIFLDCFFFFFVSLSSQITTTIHFLPSSLAYVKKE